MAESAKVYSLLNTTAEFEIFRGSELNGPSQHQTRPNPRGDSQLRLERSCRKWVDAGS